jgi:hypothetical protein
MKSIPANRSPAKVVGNLFAEQMPIIFFKRMGGFLQQRLESLTPLTGMP